METTFKIDNSLIHSANGVATVIALPDGRIQMHISKSRFTGGSIETTSKPLEFTDRAEFARHLVAVLFGELSDKKLKVFTKEELNF